MNRGVLQVIISASGLTRQPAGAALRTNTWPATSNATLVPVLAWLPPGGDLADRRAPCQEPRRIRPQDARQRLCAR
jgi:hypothetical protein